MPYEHQRAGSVASHEAMDWAWMYAPLPPEQMLVLLAVARHVALAHTGALPVLLSLTQDEVDMACEALTDAQLLCPAPDGGVHVSLDCTCA